MKSPRVQMVRWVFACALLSITLVGAKASLAEPNDNAFLKALSYIPNTKDVLVKGELMPLYVDFRAIEQAQGLTAPASREAYNALDQAGQMAWRRAILRVTFTYQMTDLFRYIDKMPQLVGFDWFNVDETVNFGTPPRRGLIFIGRFDPAKIGAALTQRGFEKSDVSGIPLWHRFEDGSLNIASRDPGDPFGGDLGKAARVGVTPTVIINSAFTDLSTDLVNTMATHGASLADTEEYRTLALAVSDPSTFKGPVLQAGFFDPTLLTLDAQRVSAKSPGASSLSDYGELPPYSLGLLADHQDGADQVNTIALLYNSPDTAKSASTELLKRMRSYLPQITTTAITFDPIMVFVDSSVQSPKYAVALISIRYPIPDADQSGQLPSPGFVLHRWTQAIYQRGFFPLVIGKPVVSK